MNAAKRKRLEAAGWRFGTVQEFLNLSDADMACIETKLALTKALRYRMGCVSGKQNTNC